MSAAAAFPRSLSEVRQETATSAIPWYIWLSVFGVTSAMVGVEWDISWHKSIGRDSFWTPAHLAIQLCGLIAGITCGYLILRTTFSKSPLRAASVDVFGFRGPLGAFICAWGGFTMITSAPFDDWWHNAYGLDVKILSPPHIVLALGIVGVEFGAMVQIAAAMNRTAGKVREHLGLLFHYVSSMILIALSITVLELTSRPFQHSAISYRTIALIVPLIAAMTARGEGSRWAATLGAGFYTVFMLAMEWILPLFPAQPRLGPVMHVVDQFIPNGFPLLIIVPAFVLDLVRPRIAAWSNWKQAILGGLLFLAVYFPTQWVFADFLQSPAAHNWFFGSNYLSYAEGPNSFNALNRFVPYETTRAQFQTNLALAAVAGMFSTWLGLGIGDWLKRVRR
jgi:hypothetical protein